MLWKVWTLLVCCRQFWKIGSVTLFTSVVALGDWPLKRYLEIIPTIMPKVCLITEVAELWYSAIEVGAILVVTLEA